MPFLQAFNASDGKWTPYASFIQVELYEVTGNRAKTDFAVRFLYQGQELKLPFCDVTPCPVTRFEEYVRAITPQDPSTQCKVSNPKIWEEPPVQFLPSPRMKTVY